MSADGSQQLSYDVSGKVTEVRDEDGVLIARYAYDDRGFRVSKQSYTSGALNKTTYYVRDAGGSMLSTYEQEASQPIAQTEVPVYGSGRLGLYQPSDGTLDFELKDHLGNVRSIISSQAGTLNIKYYADYYAYGSILRSGGTPSRFGFQGEFAEDETESTGYNIFAYRSYNPVIGRWLSPDPAGQHFSPYLAMSNNPSLYIDPNGLTDWPSLGWATLNTVGGAIQVAGGIYATIASGGVATPVTAVLITDGASRTILGFHNALIAASAKDSDQYNSSAAPSSLLGIAGAVVDYSTNTGDSKFQKHGEFANDATTMILNPINIKNFDSVLGASDNVMFLVSFVKSGTDAYSFYSGSDEFDPSKACPECTILDEVVITPKD